MSKLFTGDPKSLKTDGAREKEARELAIYNEFQELASRPGAMKTQVTKLLCEKHKIYSPVTLLNIRRRVEQRLYQNLISA